MAGYYGYSMSNNAVEAYEDGEMPLSKWTKTEIMSRLKEYEVSEEMLTELKKLKKQQLKDLLLTKSSWHHTSSYYNETDFYTIDDEALEELTLEKIRELATCEPTKENPETPEKWECKFLIWGGSRNHPKATEYTEIGEIRGNWFYRKNGTKKSVNANGFVKIRKV